MLSGMRAIPPDSKPAPLIISSVPIARWRTPPPFVVGRYSGLGQFESSAQVLPRLTPVSCEFVGAANFGARNVRKVVNSAVFIAPDEGSF